MKVRPFYTYYVAHIIRQYFFSDPPVNPTPAYRMNADAVKKVVGNLSKRDVTILKDIYRTDGENGPSVSVRVAVAAEHYGLDKSDVWELVSTTERRVAQARQLI